MIEIGNIQYANQEHIIDIRDEHQVIKAKIVVPDEAKHHKKLMTENYISFSFDTDVFLSFVRGDYMEWEGTRYTLRDNYFPTEENSTHYNYELQFDAPEILLQDISMSYLRQNLQESEWKLTSNAGRFVQVAVDNINRYHNSSDWKVGNIEPADIEYIQFDNTNVFNALTQIAEKFEAEWYVTDKTIHLVNKFQYGAEIDFENELSVKSMSRSDGNKIEGFTRLVALGSTRNIPTNYRQTSQGEAIDAIYQKRLRTPVSKGNIIDAYPNMSNIQAKETTVIFDDIYPKRVGALEEVITYPATETNEETNEVTYWNAYRFKDSGITFSKSYILPDQELRIVFQSGNLNGMDFAVWFNPNNVSEATPEAQLFEIVRSTDYGVPVPNDALKPKVGDKYVLYGFNINLVADQYVPQAEQELYDKAVKWLEDNLKDKSVYECSTMIPYFSDNEMDLDIGQKIKLINTRFDGGGRSSRIMGFKKCLHNKFDAVYTVGDNASYSRLAEIEQKIEELKYAEEVYQGTGNNIYLIKQFDNTTPTDFNAYSAKYSNNRFFNKITGGTIEKDTSFKTKAMSDIFQNDTFTSGQFGTGFKIWKGDNGQSYAELDNLLVRRNMDIAQLTIGEIKSVGGQILVSLASMSCSGVEVQSDGYKCFFNNDNGTIPNQFAVNDQVICRRFDSQSIIYYWRRALSVGADYIILSKTDVDGAGIPAVGDDMIQFGNRTNVARQSAIMISAYGSDAPSIKQYAGINSYNLTGKEATVISPSGNKFTGSFQVKTKTGEVRVLENEITSVVESVNNMKIGGRNLLKGTNKGSLLWGHTIQNGTHTRNSIDALGVNAFKHTTSVVSTGYHVIHQSGLIRPLIQAGEEYTLSFDINCEYDTVCRALIVNSNGLNLLMEFPNISISKGEWQKVELTGTATSDTGTAQVIYLTGFNKVGSVIVANLKLEKGNIATAWLSAPEDMQSEIDAKNQTYYQDNQPTVPSGGFKVGDLWYKTSLVDFDGNINTNSSKNIYQLQYRWDGTTWKQINWSAGRSFINQTAKDITSIVEDIDINGKGVGNKLHSMIQQQAGKIEFAVKRIGGRNLLLGTSETIRATGNNVVNQTTTIGKLSGYGKKIERSVTLVFSCNWKAINPVSGWFVIQTGTYYKDVSQIIYLNSTTKSGVLTGTFTIPEKDVSLWNTKAATVYIRMDNVPATTTIEVWNAMFEFAEESADWSPALEDIVGSSLRLEENKIYLGSKDIVLDGNTIAQAIGARSLNVGDGNFKVGGDGIIEAKGAIIEGTIKTAHSGERIVMSKENNSISIIDEKDSTKVLIKPTDITPIPKLKGNDITINWSGLTASGSFSRTSSSQVSETKYYMSNILHLPLGKKYDIKIPSIHFSAEVTAELNGSRPPNVEVICEAVFVEQVSGRSYSLGSLISNEVNPPHPLSHEIKGGVVLHSLEGGNYYIRVTLTMRADPPSYIWMNLNSSFSSGGQIGGSPLMEFTEIGRNGILSVWSINKYFHMTSEKLEIRYGQYVLKISDDGIKKSVNGADTWSNV